MQFLFNYLGVVLDIGQSKGLDYQSKHKVYFREKEIMLNEFILGKLLTNTEPRDSKNIATRNSHNTLYHKLAP